MAHIEVDSSLNCGMPHCESADGEMEIGVDLVCCTMGTDVLFASDGVIYTSEPEPLFTTE